MQFTSTHFLLIGCRHSELGRIVRVFFRELQFPNCSSCAMNAPMGMHMFMLPQERTVLSCLAACVNWTSGKTSLWCSQCHCHLAEVTSLKQYRHINCSSVAKLYDRQWSFHSHISIPSLLCTAPQIGFTVLQSTASDWNRCDAPHFQMFARVDRVTGLICYAKAADDRYQLSLIDPRDKIVLQTELDDLCDKLQRSSVGVLNYYRLCWPTTPQFSTLWSSTLLELSW